MKNCKAEIIHSFSQRKYKTTLNSIASFSTLTSQEDQYKIDLLRLRKTRVRLGSELDKKLHDSIRPLYSIKNYSMRRPPGPKLTSLDLQIRFQAYLSGEFITCFIYIKR